MCVFHNLSIYRLIWWQHICDIIHLNIHLLARSSFDELISFAYRIFHLEIQVLRVLRQLKQLIQWNWIESRFSRVKVLLVLIHHCQKRPLLVLPIQKSSKASKQRLLPRSWNNIFIFELFHKLDFHSLILSFDRVNPIDYSWETHLMVPKIRIEGNYHMQGRILVIPLNGHGKCWFEPSNFTIILSQSLILKYILCSCVYICASENWYLSHTDTETNWIRDIVNLKNYEEKLCKKYKSRWLQ